MSNHIHLVQCSLKKVTGEQGKEMHQLKLFKSLSKATKLVRLVICYKGDDPPLIEIYSNFVS
jgi:hypothetical protein